MNQDDASYCAWLIAINLNFERRGLLVNDLRWLCLSKWMRTRWIDGSYPAPVKIHHRFRFI